MGDQVRRRRATSTAVTVAVIGAGMSGLCCARRLVEAGWSVRLFDKARRAGGRMSTRRNDGGLAFDHGAQYFTARDPAFISAVEDWCAMGLVAQWRGAIVTLGAQAEAAAVEVSVPAETPVRYVAVPSMSALARHLAADLEVSSATRIVEVRPESGRFTLSDEAGVAYGDFDWVVVTVPAAQAVPLLHHSAELARAAEAADMAPCWAVMAAFDGRLPLAFDGAFVQGSPLGWVARQSSKPGRDATEAWVLHATAEWTAAHWDDPSGDVVATLLAELGNASSITVPTPTWSAAHRWKFALPTAPLSGRYLLDRAARIGAGGDWCGGPRVEGAALSGLALAEAMLAD